MDNILDSVWMGEDGKVEYCGSCELVGWIVTSVI